jgi:glycosyltransferase involved in cell wall biosynthesis
MTNAAIFMHADAFDTTGEKLLGRHSAGESFLRGFIRHSGVDELCLWHAGGSTLASLEALVRRIEPSDIPIRWIYTTQRGDLARPGVLSTPGAHLGPEAWARRPYGATRYSICGLTHTTATARTMDNIADYLIAPVEGHDALICTSSAVRASVEAQLDAVRDYLREEHGGPRRREEPQRVTIPLGVNTDDFATSPEHRQAWRAKLEIPDDAVVALYVGRFHVKEKMNPALMALALEAAAQRTQTPLYWVNSGWAPTEAETTAYHDATRALCPSVHYRQVDGRPPETRFSIWSVADVFISFSDNIQETFGLTPVEAMAAGLPCVVTDWDGYRDTVRDGEDGFRIATTGVKPGDGFDLAYRHANGWLTYTDYVGAAAQFTAVDFAASAEAICALIANPDLRRRLGAQARARAREVFDWRAIVPQYQALWADQNARRMAASPQPPIFNNPFRLDPFTLFAAYPSRSLSKDWTVALAPGMDWPLAQLRLSGPLADYGDVQRPTLAESQQVVAWLADRPEGLVSDLVRIFPPARQAAMTRGLLWIARFGVIELRPPQ